MKISVFYEHILEAASQTGKSLTDILTIARNSGIDAVDIEAIHLYNQEEDTYRKLKDAGLCVSCIYSFFDFGHTQDIKSGYELIELANSVDAGRVLVIPGFIGADDNREVVIDKMKEAVRSICSYAKGKGVDVCMEDFDDCHTPYSTIQGLASFMSEIPELSCAFDTGNFLYSEEDAEEALSILMPYIKHVHLKDRSLIEKNGENPKLTVKGRKLYSSAVGEGCIPMDKICHKLIDNGYNGIFVMEHFGSQNQLEDMIKSAGWIKRLTNS